MSSHQGAQIGILGVVIDYFCIQNPIISTRGSIYQGVQYGPCGVVIVSPNIPSWSSWILRCCSTLHSLPYSLGANLVDFATPYCLNRSQNDLRLVRLLVHELTRQTALSADMLSMQHALTLSYKHAHSYSQMTHSQRRENTLKKDILRG
jgi:hypothetical protein